MLAQCREELEDLYSHLPVLQEAFPVVRVPSSAVDDQYPTLQWFPFAARRMLQRYTMVPR